MDILSIRWRLTLWYGAVLALVLSIFGGSVYLMMRHALTERAGAGLLMESAEVEQEIERAKNAEFLSSWLERRFAHRPGFDIQVTTPQGEQVFRSERIRDAGLPVPSSPPAPGLSSSTAIWTEDGSTYRTGESLVRVVLWSSRSPHRLRNDREL